MSFYDELRDAYVTNNGGVIDLSDPELLAAIRSLERRVNQLSSAVNTAMRRAAQARDAEALKRRVPTVQKNLTHPGEAQQLLRDAQTALKAGPREWEWWSERRRREMATAS